MLLTKPWYENYQPYKPQLSLVVDDGWDEECDMCKRVLNTVDADVQYLSGCMICAECMPAFIKELEDYESDSKAG